MLQKLRIPDKGPFKWQSKQYKLAWDSSETHFISYSYGKLEVSIGNFVFIEKPQPQKSPEQKLRQCLIGKVIELYDTGEGNSVDTAYARIEWYAHLLDIPPEHRDLLPTSGAGTENFSREVVKDIRPELPTRVKVSSIIAKCFILHLEQGVPGSLVWETEYNGDIMFYCRWQYNGQTISPVSRSDSHSPSKYFLHENSGTLAGSLMAKARSSLTSRAPEQKGGLDPFCHECSTSFHNFSMLADHIGIEHYDEGPVSCPFCEFTGNSISRLKTHFRNTHASKSAPATYQCNVCRKHFKMLTHLRAHSIIHKQQASMNANQRVKIIKCFYCDFTTPELPQMKRHMYLVHKGKFPYNCSFCKKGFVLPSLLFHHKEFCTRSNPLPTDDSDDYDNQMMIAEEDSKDGASSTTGADASSDVPHVELSLDQLNEISSDLQQLPSSTTASEALMLETSQSSTTSSTAELVSGTPQAQQPPLGIFTMSKEAQEALNSVLNNAASTSDAQTTLVTADSSGIPTTMIVTTTDSAILQAIQPSTTMENGTATYVAITPSIASTTVSSSPTADLQDASIVKFASSSENTSLSMPSSLTESQALVEIAESTNQNIVSSSTTINLSMPSTFDSTVSTLSVPSSFETTPSGTPILSMPNILDAGPAIIPTPTTLNNEATASYANGATIMVSEPSILAESASPNSPPSSSVKDAPNASPPPSLLPDAPGTSVTSSNEHTSEQSDATQKQESLQEALHHETSMDTQEAVESHISTENEALSILPITSTEKDEIPQTSDALPESTTPLTKETSIADTSSQEVKNASESTSEPMDISESQPSSTSNEVQQDETVSSELKDKPETAESSEEHAEKPQQSEETREIIYLEATDYSEGGEPSSGGDIHKLIFGASEFSDQISADGTHQLIIDPSQLIHQDGEDGVIYYTQDDIYPAADGTQYIIIQPEMLQSHLAATQANAATSSEEVPSTSREDETPMEVDVITSQAETTSSDITTSSQVRIQQSENGESKVLIFDPETGLGFETRTIQENESSSHITSSSKDVPSGQEFLT